MTFNLRDFLTENKLTSNSKLLKEMELDPGSSKEGREIDLVKDTMLYMYEEYPEHFDDMEEAFEAAIDQVIDIVKEEEEEFADYALETLYSLTFSDIKPLLEIDLGSGNRTDEPAEVEYPRSLETEWDEIDGELLPTITYLGKRFTLKSYDVEEADDPGDVFITYVTDKLPEHQFTIVGADLGVHQGVDPTYYGGDSWEVYIFG